LKIAFFTQYLNPSGTFFRWHNLALGLKELGHEIVVHTASYLKDAKDEQRIIDGIPYYISAVYFPFQKYFGQWSHPYAYYKRYNKQYEQYDVVHVFQPFGSATAGWKKAGRKAKLKVYDWDDLWADGLLKDKASYIYKQASGYENNMPRIADCVTVCSHFLQKRAFEQGAKKAHILYNGLWQNQTIDPVQARQKLGLKEDAFYLGFMGRTIDELSWCYALLEKYQSVIPDLRLALCGMPKELLPESSLSSQVVYLGLLPPGDIKYFSSALNLGLLPLENNSFNQSRFPIKFADYISTGTPIYASEVGECSELSSEIEFMYKGGTSKEEWIKNFSLIPLAELRNKPMYNKTVPDCLKWTSISKALEHIYLAQLHD
jgi:glycosyltransferase involved in cell wall biosynthesis